MLGLLLQYRSWQAGAILAVHYVFQLQGMKWEEKVLAEAFPEYTEYCRKSHRLIPGLYLCPWRRRRKVVLAVIAVTAALTFGAVPLLRGTLYYPTLTMTAGDELRLGFVKYGMIDSKTCESRVASLASTLRKSCPACRVVQR